MVVSHEHTNIKSLCCTPETNITYVNSTSIKIYIAFKYNIYIYTHCKINWKQALEHYHNHRLTVYLNKQSNDGNSMWFPHSLINTAKQGGVPVDQMQLGEQK